MEAWPASVHWGHRSHAGLIAVALVCGPKAPAKWDKGMMLDADHYKIIVMAKVNVLAMPV